MVQGTSFGALYFAADVACDFDTLRDTLLVRCWRREE